MPYTWKEKQQLFKQGRTLYLYPLRAYALLYPNPSAASSPSRRKNPTTTLYPIIPKRTGFGAVQRNQIKRRLRAACKACAGALEADLQRNQQRLLLAILYTTNQPTSYHLLEKRLAQLLRRLRSKLALGTRSDQAAS